MILSTLTPELNFALEQLSHRRLGQLCELRFRRGRPVTGVFPWGEELIYRNGQPIAVNEALLKTLLDRATSCSPYALRMEETGLYLPLENGCRMGLCGETVLRDGKIHGLRHISSLVIRFAREIPGAADGAIPYLTQGGQLSSALILSPPGGGKTTFLRDLIRQLSTKGIRIGVVDQRRELAAQKEGENTLNLGPCTDVLSGCPKDQGMALLLRVMNPQIMAVDELWGTSELETVREIAGAGVRLLATAHARDKQQVCLRPGFRQLMEEGVFDYIIELDHYHIKRMERLGDGAETGRGNLRGGGVPDERMDGAAGAQPSAAAAAGASAGAGAYGAGDGAPYAAHAGVV
ncbi:MAG: stage III sporulation protein AB [Oscillospiraceae bacterium]|nr:stage III sporulation protein AB [Oscillospiraceae bacterium]